MCVFLLRLAGIWPLLQGDFRIFSSSRDGYVSHPKISRKRPDFDDFWPILCLKIKNFRLRRAQKGSSLRSSLGPYYDSTTIDVDLRAVLGSRSTSMRIPMVTSNTDVEGMMTCEHYSLTEVRLACL